ncbi:hypothetical protein XA68_10421 [Ophiocordyceps unilateralis]|uniref:GST N-terminal domain-containing protein n=1 Tax=Ophiocordyceps unilateralis TaxID=268505 RepID=A0A2A9PNR1_OPHUN|nr:hypothetical protein XA68_10421 [Ophiocordyceps unilateralis]
MAPENKPPLVLYDIASGPPRRTFAPNPWKSRLALNFKSASFSTNWVELPDVTSTRKALGVAAVRKFPDGSDFFTLPVLHDESAKHFVGDTFDIALYLDEKYPDGPRLIAPGMAGVTKMWNNQVDQLFTRFMELVAINFPFNPENAEKSKEILVERATLFRFGGNKSDKRMTWDDFDIRGEKRTALMADFKKALNEFEAFYTYGQNNNNNKDGPFLNGREPIYADIIVAAWLATYHQSLPADELAELKSWNDGRWTKIWQGLERYAK